MGGAIPSQLCPGCIRDSRDSRMLAWKRASEQFFLKAPASVHSLIPALASLSDVLCKPDTPFPSQVGLGQFCCYCCCCCVFSTATQTLTGFTGRKGKDVERQESRRILSPLQKWHVFGFEG